MLQLRSNVRIGPEAQGGDYLLTLRPVEHVERDYARRDRSQQAQQLSEAQIDKVHCKVPLATMGPKIASSTGTSV